MIDVDWSKVPEGYDWVAQDANGDVYAHAHEPWCDSEQKEWYEIYNSSKWLHDSEPNPEWEETKVQRPDV